MKAVEKSKKANRRLAFYSEFLGGASLIRTMGLRIKDSANRVSQIGTSLAKSSIIKAYRQSATGRSGRRLATASLRTWPRSNDSVNRACGPVPGVRSATTRWKKFREPAPLNLMKSDNISDCHSLCIQRIGKRWILGSCHAPCWSKH